MRRLAGPTDSKVRVGQTETPEAPSLMPGSGVLLPSVVFPRRTLRPWETYLTRHAARATSLELAAPLLAKLVVAGVGSVAVRRFLRTERRETALRADGGRGFRPSFVTRSRVFLAGGTHVAKRELRVVTGLATVVSGGIRVVSATVLRDRIVVTHFLCHVTSSRQYSLSHQKLR